MVSDGGDSGNGGGGSGSGGGGGGGGGAGRGGAAQRGGFGGSQRQQQPPSRETPSAQQLREWYAGRGRSVGVGPCTYVLRTGGRRGETCGLPHTAQRCFGRLTDAWHAQFPDAVELLCWGDLLRQNVAIFDLDFDAMYAVTDSAEGDCYLCVPPDLGIEAAALGASASAAPGTGESTSPGAGESALSGTAPTEALHTFTLDSSASRSFFRDSTTLTPLSRPVAVSLADPCGGPVLAHSSTVLPCPAAPSGLLSGLHLPSFSTNLVSGADLQDAWVDQFTPGGQRVTHCTCSRTGRHLATFTCRPGSSLYTLTTASPPVTASGQVAASGHVFTATSRSSPAYAPCSCCPVSHETLLWHHRIGHPSLPRLRGMASRTLGHERYFLLVVDDYSRYTTVFPLHSKDDVTEVLIDWIRGTRRQLSESFGSDLLVLRLHSDRGGEFSSDLLRAFCRAEGLLSAALAWSWTLLYAAHQINLQPRVSLPETTPTLRWTGKVGDASAFRFYHPTLRRVLSSQDVTFDESVSYYRLFPYRTASLPPPPLFLAPGAPPLDPLPPQGPAPSGVSQVDLVEPVEVAIDSGAARGAEPAGAGTGGAEPGVIVSEGAEPGGDEPERVEPGGAEPERVEPGGAELERVEPGNAELGGAESGGPPVAGGACGAAGGAAGDGAAGGASRARAARGAAGAGAAGAAGPGGTVAVGGPVGVGAAGGTGAAGPGSARTGGTGAAGAGGAAGDRAVATGGASGAGAVGGASGAGAVGGASGAGAVGGTGAGDAAGVVVGYPGAEGTGAVSTVSRGDARPRPYYVPLLQQVLGLPPSTSPPPPLLSPPPVQSRSQLEPTSPLPGPSPYSGLTRRLTERREPESRPASPESRSESPIRTVRAGRRVSRPRPPHVPGTHSMTLRPSTAPQRVPLPSPPASFLPAGPDPESDSLRAASPTVTRFLATAVTDPLFDSSAASALVAELSVSVCPPSVGGECALGTDVLEDRQEEFECFAAAVPHLVSMLLALEGDPDAPDIPTPRSYTEAIEGPYSSQWQAAMDAEMASWKSAGTYVDEVPLPGVNIVSGMWIFRVKRPPGSPPVFKARYVARGFSQRQGVDFFQTFSPTPKMTTLRGSLHEEIWLRRPPGFTGSFPAGTQWSLWRPVYNLRQAPREWHDTVRTTLAALGFSPSTADPSLFLRTNTTLPPFYVLVYVDDLVFATADTEALAHVKLELQKRHTCTDLGELTSYLGLRITRDRAQRTITLTQSHMVQQVLQRFGITYSLPHSSPLPTGHSLSAPPSDKSVEPSGP
ncbi:unnamed protein product [Closterium sp. NIES-53]